MSKPTRPADRLAAAKLAALDAQAEVTESSRKRLAELQRLPPHARLEALNDAALEPAERQALRRSLAPLLSRPAKSAPQPKTPLAGRDFAVLLNWKIGALLVLATGVAVAAGRSGGERVVFARAIEIRALMPNGAEGWLALKSGEPVVMTNHDRTDANIRIWRAREGYAYAKVPLDLLAASPR